MLTVSLPVVDVTTALQHQCSCVAIYGCFNDHVYCYYICIEVAKTSRGCKPTVLCGGKFATGHAGVIQSDSTSKDSTSKVTFTDANDRQAAGEITMDSSGALGLKDHGGGG